MANPDELVLSRARVRREIEALRDMLEKPKTPEEHANLRGQIGILRKLLKPGALDHRHEAPLVKPADTEPDTPALY